MALDAFDIKLDKRYQAELNKIKFLTDAEALFLKQPWKAVLESTDTKEIHIIAAGGGGDVLGCIFLALELKYLLGREIKITVFSSNLKRGKENPFGTPLPIGNFRDDNGKKISVKGSKYFYRAKAGLYVQMQEGDIVLSEGRVAEALKEVGIDLLMIDASYSGKELAEDYLKWQRLNGNRENLLVIGLDMGGDILARFPEPITEQNREIHPERFVKSPVTDSVFLNMFVRLERELGSRMLLGISALGGDGELGETLFGYLREYYNKGEILGILDNIRLLAKYGGQKDEYRRIVRRCLNGIQSEVSANFVTRLLAISEIPPFPSNNGWSKVFNGRGSKGFVLRELLDPDLMLQELPFGVLSRLKIRNQTREEKLPRLYPVTLFLKPSAVSRKIIAPQLKNTTQTWYARERFLREDLGYTTEKVDKESVEQPSYFISVLERNSGTNWPLRVLSAFFVLPHELGNLAQAVLAGNISDLDFKAKDLFSGLAYKGRAPPCVGGIIANFLLFSACLLAASSQAIPAFSILLAILGFTNLTHGFIDLYFNAGKFFKQRRFLPTVAGKGSLAVIGSGFAPNAQPRRGWWVSSVIRAAGAIKNKLSMEIKKEAQTDVPGALKYAFKFIIGGDIAAAASLVQDAFDITLAFIKDSGLNRGPPAAFIKGILRAIKKEPISAINISTCEIRNSSAFKFLSDRIKERVRAHEITHLKQLLEDRPIDEEEAYFIQAKIFGSYDEADPWSLIVFNKQILKVVHKTSAYLREVEDKQGRRYFLRQDEENYDLTNHIIEKQAISAVLRNHLPELKTGKDKNKYYVLASPVGSCELSEQLFSLKPEALKKIGCQIFDIMAELQNPGISGESIYFKDIEFRQFRTDGDENDPRVYFVDTGREGATYYPADARRKLRLVLNDIYTLATGDNRYLNLRELES
ncbi:MAG: DUF1152 domain-containing protein, partial [Candidatus Omnitrophica bacterium]|nr:DUF1152 domain-containing protein [Candidatus Omnitrophota bacterium]